MAITVQGKRKRRQVGEASEQLSDAKRAKSEKPVEEASSNEKNDQLSYYSDRAILDPQLLADHLANQTARFAPDLSPLELEELRVPGMFSFHMVTCHA
jgi:hypothetical protein